MLVIALGMAVFWRHDAGPSSPSPVNANASVAVLPFVAMSDDSGLRHLGEGIAEEITNQLVGRPGLEVASRTSAFQARDGRDAVAIAHALGVSYVVEGSVRPFGDQTRLTAQLIRAEDGFHVWSETFDLPANSSPVEQDKTLRTLSLMVNAYVNLDQQLRDERSQTTSGEAWRHYAAAARLKLQGNTGGTTLPNPTRQIVEELDRAIALDPNFAAAYGLRANAYVNLVGGEVRWATAGPEARRSIEKALALQPDKPFFLIQLALIQMMELDLTAAQRTLERVRSISPDNRYLNQCLAYLAMQRGRPEEAMRYWQQDFEKNPYASASHVMYAVLLVRAGDFAAADHEYDEAFRLAPRGPTEVYVTLARALDAATFQGDIEKASALFEPVWARYRHTFPQQLGPVLAATGHETEARELLTNMLRDPGTDPSLICLTYFGLKDHDSTLKWLRRAIDDRNANMLRLVRLPNAFPGLSQQPGYADVLKYLDSLQRSP